MQYERLEALPPAFFRDNNLTGSDNLIVFRITLPTDLGGKIESMEVFEYHKGRREPYPKTIKVYEKQTVELYESKYYLSVYPTEQCEFDLKVKQSDVHYLSE